MCQLFLEHHSHDISQDIQIIEENANNPNHRHLFVPIKLSSGIIASDNWVLTRDGFIIHNEVIATGSMSTILKGTMNESTVAVKRYPPEYIVGTYDAFIKELEACLQLHHPNIVKFLGPATHLLLCVLCLNYVSGVVFLIFCTKAMYMS